MSAKPQLLRYTEWQGESGRWYCNDISDLTSVRAKWWAPARMMNISPAEYAQWIISNFKPDTIIYYQEQDVLIYSWKKQADMRVFKNKLNALARKYNYII
jgi:hypothetical protein